MLWSRLGAITRANVSYGFWVVQRWLCVGDEERHRARTGCSDSLIGLIL